MNGPGQLVDLLRHSELFHKYEHAFTEATGLPLALRAVETWRLPLHGKRKESPFCALMAERSRTCAACLRLQEELAQAAMHGPANLTCVYGLEEIAVPVKLGPQTIGFLETGQVLAHEPTHASFRRALAQAEKVGVHLDEARARFAYEATPVLARKRMESLTSLLEVFADYLALQSNQIAVHEANAEPPVIARARRFIEDHAAEDLSLGLVSEAVHTSRFYFCKLFRQVTGVTFTEFVSRVRTEKAANLLLNPNLRVSEIAYEVGFRSLTHFNRVFKKVVGQSPSDYRAHLPSGSHGHDTSTHRLAAGRASEIEGPSPRPQATRAK